MVRGFLAKRRYKQLRIDSERTQAAIVIQRSYRGHYTRTHLDGTLDRAISAGQAIKLTDERRSELQSRIKAWRVQNGKANRPRAEVEQILREV